MNVAYFNSTITQMNEIVSYLNAYSAYITGALSSTNLTCAELDQLALEAAAKLAQAAAQAVGLNAQAISDTNAMQSNITAQLALLAPLLVAPTNLAGCITWIESAINTYAVPNASYLAQQAIIVAQIAAIASAFASVTSDITSITSAINNAIANKKSLGGCV